MILGIDPGQKGAMALLRPDGRFRSALLTTCNKSTGAIELGPIVRWLETYGVDIEHAYVEESTFYMAKNGALSLKELGRSVGHFEMALAMLGIPSTKVRPQEWQTRLLPPGGKDTTKSRALIVVSHRFPTIELRKNRLCKNAHEGLVDALLIAEYGRLGFMKKKEHSNGAEGITVGRQRPQV